MQLFEVKNDIAKIIYNPAENHLLPYDFLLIEDVKQKLIARIINIETSNNQNNDNIAVLKLSLSIDNEDNLSYYNGYIPSKNSKIIYINPDEIIELIKDDGNNIYFGNLANHSTCFVKTKLSFLDDKLHILSDRDDKTYTVVQNIITELQNKNKNVILLDFDGRYSGLKNVERLKISDNFKLPLNIDAFNTILEYDITECPIEDKALIQSIVLELRGYLQTLEDKYIPFTMFKNVVDDEFLANPISGLMLFRNKLCLYMQEHIFAESKDQFNITELCQSNKPIVIDASGITEKWYKYIIQTIAKLISKNYYLFLFIDDVKADKKFIINLYNQPEIIPIISTSYNSPYKQILKSICKNQILCKPMNIIKEDEEYGALLNKINTDEMILCGETTLYLPLLVELHSFTPSTTDEILDNEIKKDVDKLLFSTNSVIPQITNTPADITKNIYSNEIIEDDGLTDSDLDFLDETMYSENKLKTEETSFTVDKSREENNEKPETKQMFPENEEEYENEKLSVKDSNPEEALNLYNTFHPIAEEEQKKTGEETLKTDNIPSNENIDEEVKAQILEKEFEQADILPQQKEQTEENKNIETDSIKTDNKEENNLQDTNLLETDNKEIMSDKVNTETVIDNVISNIEERFSEEETKEKTDNFVVELEDDEDEEEEQQKEIKHPELKENINEKEAKDIPVYETDNSAFDLTSELPFKIGDRVYHPKHGEGTIEGFANYSNKILFCQIEFDNVGRRILDPRISGIEKIS